MNLFIFSLKMISSGYMDAIFKLVAHARVRDLDRFIKHSQVLTAFKRCFYRYCATTQCKSGCTNKLSLETSWEIR